ncbi:MAG: rhodanese-like domain-containing protein [Alphaproteobacteria bacterium]|jgi:rhodanese-related sulfurtransferase|nr:rhodanese-like domain-containing protein [Alphaproteobacteria bacterium]|tara:strand:- start:54 stop:488 length:435 start_codon:yes stop_codon:yes gene_type:complete
MKKTILISFSIFFISFSSIANELSAIDAAKEMSNNLIIIDVRNKEEWKETGIIPNSLLIQMLSAGRTIRKEYISELLIALGEDKDIKAAIICHSGGRSSATVELLKNEGFNNIFNISEGMVGNGSTTGWINRNLPLIACNKECK